MKIAWSPKSLRSFKRLTRKNPDLRSLIEVTIRQLIEDPFHPSLRTHKLKGDFSGCWSCSIDYSYRIIFEFVPDQEEEEEEEEVILLLNLGTHDQVY
ncbi:type II toxin-antitoxin system mRNA interferase toxin, RelE/StbE family [Roseofilum sp. BLCC_M154]|uniref:Type II toxin-antitoxin system mRNA interferase toxin, RelE/StbE family n=1 Tax=Roseofilum acuticapitatum BLCC-M154 TaxID=3022444 RepID=A0ABT7APY1_9CYAN|nr:type II toxin-antitoxin system mRNA interferase toxin, RelE/StbE family [Roseofilum acuticapitatum]MDJ1168957.1 type II toxin-antitoxin system mRNA interferase toxin, RelE/StbE family [Roseofilum acuticapitatum BLCC-M154]